HRSYRYRYGRPPPVLSFPTRRSSDLRRSTVLWANPDGAIRSRDVSVAGFAGEVRRPYYRYSATTSPCFLHNLNVSPPANHLSPRDRKSTRLNSSHVKISYAVFCLKKK